MNRTDLPPLAALVCLLCIGGCDGGRPVTVDAATQGDGGCIPLSWRCVANESQRCDDGSVYRTTEKCGSMDLPGLEYSCTMCDGGKYAACQSSREIVSVTASGLVSFAFKHRPGCHPEGYGAFLNDGAGMTHYSRPVKGGGVSVGITVLDYGKAPSGTKLPLVAGSSAAVAIDAYRHTGETCSNTFYHADPPSFGTVELVYASTTRGSEVKIDVSGYLACDWGVHWRPFTYVGEGILLK